MFHKKDNIDLEITVFRPNRLDASLLYLFIILNTILAMRSLSVMEYSGRIFIFIIFNIILTLFLFLASAQIKNYIKLWSYLTIIVSVFQLMRMFFLPEHTGSAINYILYIVTGSLGILSGGFSYFKSKNRFKFIQERKEI